jgi:hypothetical protein
MKYRGMQMNSYAPPALPLENVPPTATGLEAGWTSQPVSRWWSRKIRRYITTANEDIVHRKLPSLVKLAAELALSVKQLDYGLDDGIWGQFSANARFPFSPYIHTGSGIHQASNSMVTGFFTPWVECPGRESDHSRRG